MKTQEAEKIRCLCTWKFLGRCDFTRWSQWRYWDLGKNFKLQFTRFVTENPK